MTYKVAVKVRGKEGWSYNSLRFPTIPDAEAYARNLASRWKEEKDWEIHWEIQESDDPVLV